MPPTISWRLEIRFGPCYEDETRSRTPKDRSASLRSCDGGTTTPPVLPSFFFCDTQPYGALLAQLDALLFSGSITEAAVSIARRMVVRAMAARNAATASMARHAATTSTGPPLPGLQFAAARVEMKYWDDTGGERKLVVEIEDPFFNINRVRAEGVRVLRDDVQR